MPLSRDPDKRSRQLANLRSAPPPAPPGNRRTVTHGGYAEVARARLDAKTREVFEALAADVPLRDAAGELPRYDAAQVALLAKCLCRLEDVESYVAEFGWRDQKTGEPRTGLVELEGRLRREAADYMDALGMTPRSRAKLGLDLARSSQFDLARHWAEQGGDSE